MTIYIERAMLCGRRLTSLRHENLLRGSDAAVDAFMRKQSPSELMTITEFNSPGGLLRQPEHGGDPRRADDHPRALVELTPRGRVLLQHVVVVLRVIGFCACSLGDREDPVLFMSAVAQLAGALSGRAVDDATFAGLRELYTFKNHSTHLPDVPDGAPGNKTTDTFAAVLVGTQAGASAWRLACMA